MMVSRRALLGAVVGGGSLAALGAVFGAAPARALPSGTALLLVDSSVTARAARDVRKGLGIAGPTLTITGPETLAAAAGWLAAVPGRRVAGLVADGDGILFQQMVPRGSARWRSAAHHASPAALMSFVVEG